MSWMQKASFRLKSGAPRKLMRPKIVWELGQERKSTLPHKSAACQVRSRSNEGHTLDSVALDHRPWAFPDQHRVRNNIQDLFRDKHFSMK